jgi:hypothetical protein
VPVARFELCHLARGEEVRRDADDHDQRDMPSCKPAARGPLDPVEQAPADGGSDDAHRNQHRRRSRR